MTLEQQQLQNSANPGGQAAGNTAPPATGSETVPNGVGVPTATGAEGKLNFTTIPGQQQVEFKIPDAHKDAPWAKNVKSYDDLWEQHKNAQELIGKKTTGFQYPGENATEEEIMEFRKQLGVPDKPDQYQYEPPQLAPEDKELEEFLAKSMNQQMMTELKERFWRLGVPSALFTAMAKQFDEVSLKYNKDSFLAQKKAEQEANLDFHKKMEQRWGQNVDQAVKSGNDLLRRVLPPEVFGKLTTLNNDALVELSVVAHHIRQSLFKEGGGVNINNATGAVTSLAQLQEVGTKLMLDPAYTDPMHPNHKAQVQRVNDWYDQQKRFA